MEKLMNPLPVMKAHCASCPFLPESEYRALAPDLAKSALTEASRICHCTGSSGIKGNTGKPDRLCRGARDIQLAYYAAIGFIAAPTDEAWAAKVAEMNAANGASPIPLASPPPAK